MTLRLNGSASGYTELEAAPVAGNNKITLPASSGSSGQILKNSNGVLDWSQIRENADGSISLVAGTAAAPSLSFTGDSNTGIYSPGADQVAISTGGTGRLFVDASGNVGVGASSPTRALDVNGSIQLPSNNALYINGSNNYLYADSTATELASATLIKFVANGSERLRITSAGLVGVGTSSPSNAFQIESDANSDQGVWVRNSNTGSSASSNVYVNSAAGQLLFRAHSAAHSVWPATALISSSSGLTGGLAFNTGAAAPLAFLTNNSERLRITSTGQLSHIGAGSSGSPAVNFSGSAPSNSLVIDSSGNVGINTAAGGASGFGTFFKIKTTSSSPGFFLENGAADSWWGVYGGTSAADSAAIVYPSTGSIRIATSTSVGVGGFSEKIRITSAGLVGIGTSAPSVRLQVQDSIAGGSDGTVATLHNVSDTGGDTRYVGLNFRIGSDDGTSAIRAYRTNSANNYETNLSFWTNPAGATQTPLRAMTIDSYQRVGIGTSTPQASLDIASGTFQAVRTNLSSVTDTFHQYRGTPDGVGYEHARVFSGRDTSVHTYGSYLAFYTEGKASGTTDTSLERLRIDSSGRVGIGTTSPAVNAHIFGSQAALRIESSNTDARLQLTSSSGTWVVGNSVGGTGNYLSFYDVTASSERARIDSSGRLLVGTSSSSAEAKFIVQGGATAAGGAINIQRNATTASAGSTIGFINFTNSANNVGATISADGDGTWSAGTSHPTRLVFSTTADGASSPTERMRIAANGQITHSLNGTTNAANLVLNVGGAGDPGNSGWITPRIDFAGSSLASADTTFIGATGGFGSRSLVFATGSDGAGSERARIDSSGRLLVGTSSARSGFFNGAPVSPSLQVEGTSLNGSAIALVDNENGTTGGGVIIGRSRGTTLGSFTILQNNDSIGSVGWHGADGSDFVEAARIEAVIDGTPGANDMPGRLVFSTTADGASSPTERLRIDSRGYLTALGIYNNTTAAAANVHVSSAGGELFRSTSSIKYKTDVETIQDSYSEALLNCRPVWYRSTCEGDNANWGWWGFIAEEVAEIDPRLVHWKNTEVTYDEKGTAIQTPCDPEPESVQYDRFVPHLLNLIKRQQQAIETLEAKVAALESA